MQYSDKRTIWLKANDPSTVQVIDQRRLPHEFIVEDLQTVEQTVWAIKEMVVRGAPLIGATAAYGMYFACLEAAKAANPEQYFTKATQDLRNSRPTAINLFWAIERQVRAINEGNSWAQKAQIAFHTANAIIEEDVEICRMIGVHGLPIIEQLSHQKNGEVVNILTHCNAGRLGCIEWGTISSPIYQAHQKGIKVHVWVDETRPRNQGSNLTAWELSQAGVPHTVIVDNTGGHLMQHGLVDMVIVGTDRTTRVGDVANKIGTYLKALAARDNQVPFYVALPSSTIDWEIRDGLKEIPIEERSQDEVKYIYGWNENNQQLEKVLLTPKESPACNYGFDVTPARLVTGGLITERGVCVASEAGLLGLFPEKR
ncbi:MAG: S-methyl-5-thioribose-1-phosphate isomerase [Microscillaceae bacterium]|jgi:methylthioribose-1-phosphate isomerase|nr:S-methyl-5-thioribose-1-phosphate isomerase [Microscillaceae bacterium]